MFHRFVSIHQEEHRFNYLISILDRMSGTSETLYSVPEISFQNNEYLSPMLTPCRGWGFTT